MAVGYEVHGPKLFVLLPSIRLNKLNNYSKNGFTLGLSLTGQSQI